METIEEIICGIMENFKTKFYEFLESYNCKDQYIKNFVKCIDYPNLDEFLDGVPVIKWSSRAFLWNSSPEGFDFWDKIDVNWMREVRHLI